MSFKDRGPKNTDFCETGSGPEPMFGGREEVDMSVKPIPAGFHTLTPGCAVRNSAQAIDFYKRVFGARERSRFAAPDGTVVHAEMEIGDSIFALGEATKTPPHAMQVIMYVDDCDAVYKRALGAGAVVKEPLVDHFWGDRAGRVQDPFGN